MGLFDRLRKRKIQATGIPDVDKLAAMLESQEVPGRRAIVDRFHITEHQFNTLYVSYHFSLLMSGESSAWNVDVDDFAREIGALSEQEIADAKLSLHQAVLNRIKLRFLADRSQAPPSSVSSAKTADEKAQLLVQVANWTAITSYTDMVKKFPALQGIHIMPAAGIPAFLSGFCFSSTIHVLDRYNSEEAARTGMTEDTAKEAAKDFSKDFESGNAVREGWPDSFFGCERYHPQLFLETLYFGLFQVDYLMQNWNGDHDLYMPVRNDCIQALDRHLVGGLGYGEKINDINRVLAERTAAYGQDRSNAPCLFASNIADLTARPDVFSMQALGYLSVGALKTFLPIFLNRAIRKGHIDIKCRNCSKTIASGVQKTPVTIRCHSCSHEYLVRGVWGTT